MNATEAIAETLRLHHPTRGMAVAMGVTCACGHWTQGGRRVSGDDGLDAHRADVIAGLVPSLSPEDLAELIGGELEQAAWHRTGGKWRDAVDAEDAEYVANSPYLVLKARVVGPWTPVGDQ